MRRLLRLGGNLVIPGTGKSGHRYHDLAADMGLIITHHHAEPLGARNVCAGVPGAGTKVQSLPGKVPRALAAGH
ncbi:MAG: hypothetical protein ACLU9R_04135 [Faecalibacterium sp.]